MSDAPDRRPAAVKPGWASFAAIALIAVTLMFLIRLIFFDESRTASLAVSALWALLFSAIMTALQRWTWKRNQDGRGGVTF